VNKEDKVRYFEYLVNSYDKGIAKIRGDHPEIGTIPTEYVNKLLASLAQYPQYHRLVEDLIHIIQQGEDYEA